MSGREQKRTSDRVERIEEEITFKKRQKGGELSAARSGDLGDQPGSNQYRLTLIQAKKSPTLAQSSLRLTQSRLNCTGNYEI